MRSPSGPAFQPPKIKVANARMRGKSDQSQSIEIEIDKDFCARLQEQG
jgi:hypothetical protein